MGKSYQCAARAVLFRLVVIEFLTNFILKIVGLGFGPDPIHLLAYCREFYHFYALVILWAGVRLLNILGSLGLVHSLFQLYQVAQFLSGC